MTTTNHRAGYTLRPYTSHLTVKRMIHDDATVVGMWPDRDGVNV